MAFNISEFRSKALTSAGARANLFEVSLTGVTAVTGLTDGEFQFSCKASAIPTSTIGVVEVPYFGRNIKVLGNKTFDNWSITVINDEDFKYRNAMENWMAKMSTHVGNKVTVGQTFGSGDNLYGQGVVTHFSKAGTSDVKIATYNFVNIFPVSISEIALEWGSNDTIEEFTVEFGYDYWTHAEASDTTS